MRDHQRLSIGLRILALAPGVLALLMFFVTPTYFRPMLESIVGWLLVVILSTAIFVAYGLVEVEISFFRKGRIVLGLLVLIVDTLAWLLAVWIVLLGPAALSLMKPRS